MKKSIEILKDDLCFLTFYLELIMKPNIFDYATSELSQDAFLSWIIKWADKENCECDKKMNKCGKEIVNKLSGGKIPATGEYTVDIYKQYTISNGQKMDLWITFNEFEEDPKKEKYSLVIEDKVDTSFHDSQLKNYRNEAEKWCKKNNVVSSYCYYKSGFLSATEKNLVEKVYSKGNWNAVSVYDILPTLKKYTENQIIEDYVNKFITKKVDLANIIGYEENLYKVIVNSFENNNFLVDSKRKEGNYIGVYASKNKREYWTGFWKNPDKINHCFYICCSAKHNEIDKLEKVKSENYEFDIDKGNQCFPCDFYISEKFYNDFNEAEAEEQETMLSDLIKEIDDHISNI